MKTKAYRLIVLTLALAMLCMVWEPAFSAAGAQGETHNCRFWGIISENVPTAVIQDHLVNLPNSIENLSPANPDGWSVGYYPDGDSVPTVNRGYPPAIDDPNYDLAVTEAADATPRIAVAHVRNTSSGITPASGDPHPFERVKDGRHWLMGHNGTIDKNVLLDLIRPDYLAANPPQYGSNQSEWIDSDLYQIFILQTLEDFNFQVKPALGYAIERLREEIDSGTSPSTEQLNFFLTDGTTLWAYREGNSTHTLYYLYDTTGTPYSAVASQYPSASQGSWVEMANGELITMQQAGPPVVENIEDYFGGGLLVDNYFDDSDDSAALRANGVGQDWYESRELEQELLTLDETLVGGNGSKKAAFAASATGNAYVTQEFGTAQAGVFSMQWDIYVDEILDIADPDRAGWMLIGDDTDPTRIGPNSDDSERFVYMGFMRDGGGTTGTMDLVARDRDDGWTAFTTVASGLNLDQWYTIRVVCDIPAGTYDVYVDDVFQSTVTSRHEKSSVTHISFAQWDDGAGAFYVDNVYQVADGTGHTLTMAVDPAGGGTTDPAVGAHTYPEGTNVTVTAYANAGYEFDHWTGDVADPNAASTTILMDGDKTVTAHFSSVPIVFLADNDFEASADSADLRADSPGQDWYESRGEDPALLTLDETLIGGNGTPKAAFAASTSTNAYLSQEFGAPQTGAFAVQWDIYVDQIMDISDPDRAGWMLIGDDTDSGRPGPNSNPSERFVQMAFHRDGGGSSGTMDLVARERGADFTAFTTVASGLNLDQWYTIRVDCNVPAGTYDVYVDGVFQATLSSYNAKTSVTHISFGQWNDGAGAFYVDNVYEVTETTNILTMAVSPTGGGTTNPAIGAHVYPIDEVVTISAYANAGFEFDHWTGDVANPDAASTTVVMDEDQSVTAHFVPTGVPTCVTIQRGAFGEVADGHIASGRPTQGSFTASTFTTGLSSSGENRALLRFDLDFLPAEAVVQSATLGFNQRTPASGETVHVYRITQAWSEGEPTWNTFASSYDAYAWASFISVGGDINVDVTNLVGAWVGGSHANCGLMLINSPAQAEDRYISSEYSRLEMRPWLEVCYVLGPGPAVSIDVTPETEIAVAGESVTYHATAQDAEANTWDVTAETDFSIEAGAGGSWTSNVYTSQNTGNWTVTGQYEGLSDTATLDVQAPMRTLTMAVDPAEGGTTTPPVGEHSYLDGFTIDITAVPNAGYEFDYWEGEVADPNSASTTVTMDGDKTVTAHFSPVPADYTLTMAVDPTEGGSTDPTPGDHVYAGGTVVDITATPNSGYQFDNWTGDVADPNTASTTVTMDGDKTVTAHFSPIPVAFLVDNDFEASADSDDLRTNSPNQDWYESRGDVPTLLFLDEATVGGNGTKKAGFTASTTNNAYVSQEFGTPQTGVFGVQWDIYVDEILDISGNPDRTGWMLIGDDTYSGGGPNANNSERFVYLGFYRDGGGSSGTMDLVARDRDDGWTSFTTVAAGLNLDQWYTILVVCDLDTDTYDVYVDGEFQATVSSRNVKDTVTHISFAQWNDGAGAFYVDNVYEASATTYELTMAVDPTEGGTTDPTPGVHSYPEDEVVAISATPNSGYQFDNWSGGVADPGSASTTATMDGDKTVTAHFSPIPVTFLADNDFEASVDSDDLRANGSDQDWYESRGDDPSLLFLDETTLGGNGTKKAGFTASTTGNAYLSQEFGTPQDGTFGVRWDIYVDNILDDADRDRGALMLIGDDADGINGPNSTSNDRFVFMAFHCADGCETGSANLIARETGDTYADSTAWRTVATGISLDEWHTIRVDCNLDADTYDVYVDGVLADMGVDAYASKDSLTHISFAQWNDGAGAFYVDNVYEATEAVHTLTMAADPAAGGTTDPAPDAYIYVDGTVVDISATPNAGYQFDNWAGDVADPNAASTTVTVDGDKTVTAHFSPVPAEYTLTMAADPTEGGTTDPTPGDHVYADGTVVDISVTPNAGYEFDYWEGEVADPDAASTTVTLDGDKTVTAHFLPVPTEYTLTMAVDPTEGGTTDPMPGDHVYADGTVVDISATPNAGYEFDYWEGEVADPDAASTTVTMDGDKTVTAHFTSGGEPTCVTIQRGSFGEVQDGYIWEAYPSVGKFTESRLRTGLYAHPRYGSGDNRTLIRFDLGFMPTGAVVQSAIFGIEQRAPGSGETVNIYRITQAWSESAPPSWDSFADNYDSSVIWASFLAQDGPRTADVTNLVIAWVGGAQPNYGMMLMNQASQNFDEYLSSDYSRNRPWLEVCYITP